MNLKGQKIRDLKARLSEEQYRVTCQSGTEEAFNNEYYDCKTPGKYHCICCFSVLFDSSNKFDSGTGWPSFDRPVDENSVTKVPDRSIPFMPRVEVVCGSCNAHLGHIFSDGPPSTGNRYCINSAALKLRPSEKIED